MSEQALRSAFGHRAWAGDSLPAERFLLECSDGLHIVPAVKIEGPAVEYFPDWNPAGEVVCTVSYVGPPLATPVTFVPEPGLWLLIVIGAVVLLLLSHKKEK